MSQCLVLFGQMRMVAHLPDDGTPSLPQRRDAVVTSTAGRRRYLAFSFFFSTPASTSLLMSCCMESKAARKPCGGMMMRYLASGVKRDEVEADHAACEMDLADAVRENFFLVCHCRSPVKFLGSFASKERLPKGKRTFVDDDFLG